MTWVEVSDDTQEWGNYSPENVYIYEVYVIDKYFEEGLSFIDQEDNTHTRWEMQHLDGYANLEYYYSGYVYTPDQYTHISKDTQVWQSL